jgi:hypothetical protein
MSYFTFPLWAAAIVGAQASRDMADDEATHPATDAANCTLQVRSKYSLTALVRLVRSGD